MSDFDLIQSPHSIEAEQGLIGALLLDNEVIDAIGAVRADDCYTETHRLILAEILSLIGQGKVADVVTVHAALEHAALSDRTGGLSYLAEIANNTPGTANAGRYAELVRDKAALRRLLAAGADIVAIAHAKDGATVKEKLDRAQGLVAGLADASTGKRPRRAGVVAGDWLDRYEDRMAGKREAFGLSTPWPDVNRMLGGGLEPTRMVVVAGRPGMGKTTLALNLSLHAASIGEPVLFCSQEMPDTELFSSILAAHGRIDRQALKAARLDEVSFARMQSAIVELDSMPLYLDEQANLTLFDVSAKARQIKREAGRLSLIVVDYIQLMSGHTRTENRVQEITQITMGLKQLALSMGCPVVALSQLNRGLEQRPNKRPVMSDLRESGSIEQDADIIWSVYRDEIYNPDSPDRGCAELGWLKDRQSGNVGRVTGMVYQGEFGRFDLLSGALPSENAPPPERSRSRRGDNGL